MEGTGDDVDDAHGETAVARGNAQLAAVADVGHHALNDQKDTSKGNSCSVIFNKLHCGMPVLGSHSQTGPAMKRMES